MSAVKSPRKGRRKGKQPAVIEDDTESEFQTQGFEPRESDEEQLWDVIAIRGERKGMYMIQWAGADENGQPWPDSWVPRRNVTDDLVEAWKREQAAKKKEKARKMVERRKTRRQGSTSTPGIRTDPKRSLATTSITTPRRSRRATSIGSVGRDEISSVSTIRSPPAKAKRKQRLPEGSSTAEDAPRKRRKLGSDRMSFPPNKSKGRVIYSDAAGEGEGNEEHTRVETEVRRPGGLSTRLQQEEEGESGDENFSPVLRTNVTSQRRDTGHEPEHPEEGRVVHVHEEEEDERPPAPPVRTRMVEIVLDARGSSKSRMGKTANGHAASPSSSNVQMGDRRVSDKRPTPPRRTLTKSGLEPRKSVSLPNGSKNRKKRRGPPGVRASDVAPPEPDSDITESTNDAPRNRPRSLSVVSDRMWAVSPAMRQGLTGRMKRRATGDGDGASRLSSIGREQDDAGLSTGESDRGKDRRKRTLFVQDTLGSDEDSPVYGMPDEIDEPKPFQDDGDQGFPYDPFDEPLPFSQDHEPPSVQVDSGPEPVASGGSGNVGSVRDRPDDPQSSKGTIIPATQSQSQSQQELPPESQGAAQDDLYLTSIIAEHGSDAVDIDAVLAEPPEEVLKSSETHLPPVSSSIPEPESSATTSTNAGVHKKIPVVTPSKFRPYLPHQKPLSTLPPPYILSVQGSNSYSKSNGLASSIESPVKDFDAEDQLTDAGLGTNEVDPNDLGEIAVGLEDDAIEGDMPRSLEFRQRGLKLAEIRRKKLRESNKSFTRRPLDELLEARKESSSTAQPEQGNGNASGPTSEGEGMHTLPEVPEGTTLRSELEADDETRIRQFEEDYVDFDGDANVNFSNSQQSRSVSDAVSLADKEENPRSAGTEGEVNDEAEIESSLAETVDENDPFLFREQATDGGSTPTTTTSQQDDLELSYTPVRSRFKILGSPSKLESPFVQTPSRQLNEAMGLLRAKSEEIEALKRQLAESERRRLSQDDALAELGAENAVLKKTLEEMGNISEAVDEGDLEQYKEKCESLTKDVDARDAEIQLLKMSRDDSVKQAEIFRELYGQASSFADEKKQESDELLERAKRAEGQVAVGLELVRRQYNAREQKLKEELEKQNILVTILTAKDRRTDDEVRRRAALEPELHEKIDELKEELADLETGQSIVVRQRNDLLVEKQELSEELQRLQTKYEKIADAVSLSEVQIARLTAREKAFKRVFLTTSASIHDNESDRSEERVYVCKWMNGYDAKSRCASLFSNVQDLKDHLFVDHQL